MANVVRGRALGTAGLGRGWFVQRARVNVGSAVAESDLIVTDFTTFVATPDSDLKPD
ncbi:MAG: hypothetical protein HY682_07995 [Chloroflexi bacterium]|nr:hypothetical protein [Chloroflexota bacterium]